MYKNVLILMILSAFCHGFFMYSQPPAEALKIIDLEELETPGYIISDGKILLIEDKSRVRMYDIKDFKLLKTIGGMGEGPGEFKSFACPQILSDSIMISSVQKVAFFDFSGKLVKELKTRSNNTMIKKTGNKYIRDQIIRGEDDFYIAYNLYGPNFNLEKEIYKGRWMLHKGGKRDLFEIYFYDVFQGNIIFAHREGFKIEILDKNANNIYTIIEKPSPIPFTDEDLERAFNEMSANTKRKAYVEFLRKKASKPDVYPAIRTCCAADGKIYVITYLKKDGQSECLVYDMKGKRLKRLFIPLRDFTPLVLPLFTISKNHLYQLIENDEKEVWQLVIDKIE